MSIRQGVERFKERFEGKARGTGGGNKLLQPANSQPADAAPFSQGDNSTTSLAASLTVSTSIAAQSVSLQRSRRSMVVDNDWPCFRALLKVLDEKATIFGPLKMVMGDFLACIGIYEHAVAIQRDYEVLKIQLEVLFSDLSDCVSGRASVTMTASMENLCNALGNELKHISSKMEDKAWKQYFRVNENLEDVMKCYYRVQGYLQRFALNANLTMWPIVDELANEARLNRLAPSLAARYNSAEASLVRRGECTPETRKQVLNDLSEWRYDKTQGNIYWMNGMAGTGKTTIANSLCVILDQTNELGASFFCTRLLPECRSVKRILPTIAYQLARFSRPFMHALSEELRRDPDVHAHALRRQFEGVILNPLRKIGHTLPTDLVVVIDALDECEEDDGVGKILDLLLSHLSDLPIKFYISSRPEPQIRERIGNIESKLVLQELDRTIVSSDIETYLRTELAWMTLPESQIASLVEIAGALFIYAATVVRYIGPPNSTHDPWKRLDIVLGTASLSVSKKDQDMDELYHFVITCALGDPQLEAWDKEAMKLVLHTVVCAKEPLTIDVLAGLLNLGSIFQVHAALRCLWSVLHISGEKELVSTLHASFPEYMLNRERSKEYHCDAVEHHRRLAGLCFRRIRRNERQFNICGFTSSYLFDHQVPDLLDRVDQAIPQDLVYACRYWEVHLILGSESSELLGQLDDFLSTGLLLWIEVMNLKRWMKVGVGMLERTRTWCEKVNCPYETEALVRDAWRFATMFVGSSASLSTPHIYVSMLPFWPRSEPVAIRYLCQVKGLVKIGGIKTTKHSLPFEQRSMEPGNRLFEADAWEERIVITGHRYKILEKPFAISTDCTRVACACTDRRIRVWDLRHRQEPLLLPTEGVFSAIAFSPDGIHIGAADHDYTIRLWNLRNKREVLSPLAGHSSLVTSVAFSPDGTYIASSSQDGAVLLWNLTKGPPMSEATPLVGRGHLEGITSIVFSLGGAAIIAITGHGTAVVWNSPSGSPPQPFFGGSDIQRSAPLVLLSPNGELFATIREHMITVWSMDYCPMADGRRPIAFKEISSKSPITSVASSPDGTHIAYGTVASTICVWDLRAKPHKEVFVAVVDCRLAPLTSIVFSPDGDCVASSYDDGVVSVYKVKTTQGNYTLSPVFNTCSAVDQFSSLANSVLGFFSKPLPATHTPESSEQPIPTGSVGKPWFMNEHGCIFDNHSNFLLWVPPDLQGYVMGPERTAGMFQQGARIQLDFEDAMMGESWEGCYQAAE